MKTPDPRAILAQIIALHNVTPGIVMAGVYPSPFDYTLADSILAFGFSLTSDTIETCIEIAQLTTLDSPHPAYDRAAAKVVQALRAHQLDIESQSR